MNQDKQRLPFYRFRKKIMRRVPLLLLFLACFGATLAGALPSKAGYATQDEDYLVVRIRAASVDETRRLAARGLDLLEGRDGADLLALVTPKEQEALLAEGWDVRVEPQYGALSRSTNRAAFDTGYRSVEEIEQFLRSTAANYPNLARLETFGQSWARVQSGGASGYDLLALRLTNQATPGPKPVFFLMAAIHARELTTAELATRFISHLLASYGSDPDVTWLLDEHEIVVAPMINPDGRKIAEQGFLQRKNINDQNGGNCEPPSSRAFGFSQHGVDLNRNASFQWGTAGISFEPCSETFPGAGQASEPETQALQQYLATLYPARPRPGEGMPVPEDTSGVMISLHSYYDLVLWPWGYSYDTAPDGEGLARLGQRFASFNGYRPQQSAFLYLTSGTSDEWAYATLGIAAYTFEVGPPNGPCGGFMPPYSCLDYGADGRFWPRNLPALLYAARVARAPYSQPAGPDIRDAGVVSDTTTLTLTLTIDGRDQPVSEAELYLGVSPWHGGTPLALQALDGAFDAPLETAQAVIPRAALPPDGSARSTLLLVRGRNGGGVWGPIRALWALNKPPLPQGDALLLFPLVQR